MVEYLAECQARGIIVQAPDVNISDKDFTPRLRQKTSAASVSE